MSQGTMYGRTEDEWDQLEQAGWGFLTHRAAERRGDAAHDPTVSYSDMNQELAITTGQPPFDFGQQAGRAAMGYLLGRISRNRSWPASRLLISALVRYQGEADAGPGFCSLAREVGLINGNLPELKRLEFWLDCDVARDRGHREPTLGSRVFLWPAGWSAGGLVGLVRVEDELAEELAGAGVDDSDVQVLDQEKDAGSGVGAADADVVEASVVAEADEPGLVDAVGADAVVGVGGAVAGTCLGPGAVGGGGGRAARQ
jgi:hypothetical protein